MAHAGLPPDACLHADLLQKRPAQPLHLAAIEVVVAGHQGDAQPVDDPPPQPRLVAEIAARADRHHAAEIFRQGERHGAGDAAAARKAGQIGPVGVGRVVAAHVVQHVQHGAHAPLGRAVVAGAAWAGEEEALVLADRLERLPAHRLVARRDEHDHRQRLLRVAFGRDVQFILLFVGVVVLQPFGGRVGEALVREGERPVQARCRRDRNLGW